MLESLLVMPILVVGILLLGQLVWIALAHATVQTATNYSARAGTLNHGAVEVMERTFVAGVASLIPQWLPQLPPTKPQLWQAQIKATARQWAHFQWAGRLFVHSPSPEVFAEQAEWRWDLASAQRVRELAVDHAAVRMAAAADGEQWQAERMLDIEVWWCLPLRIPLAAELLAALKNQRASAAQAFCHRRQLLTGQPLWALEHRVAYPLQSGYRGN